MNDLEYFIDFHEIDKLIVSNRNKGGSSSGGTETVKWNSIKRLQRMDVMPKSYRTPIPLSKDKFKNLRDLYQTLVNPKAYHKFYISLPHTSNIRDALDKSDIEKDDENMNNICFLPFLHI
ncbi:hypothetical protein QYM36_005272 [Artemia franciscana]|uniref:Uncharacterized protein n=1 Tax=Artemia franciscana TaxID=6661 RepID=A0AA88HYX5_ARTSF|nr:hypothetical protein QYM36_005272 [Artemia franciscana]